MRGHRTQKFIPIFPAHNHFHRLETMCEFHECEHEITNADITNEIIAMHSNTLCVHCSPFALWLHVSTACTIGFGYTCISYVLRSHSQAIFRRDTENSNFLLLCKRNSWLIACAMHMEKNNFLPNNINRISKISHHYSALSLSISLNNLSFYLIHGYCLKNPPVLRTPSIRREQVEREKTCVTNKPWTEHYHYSINQKRTANHTYNRIFSSFVEHFVHSSIGESIALSVHFFAPRSSRAIFNHDRSADSSSTLLKAMCNWSIFLLALSCLPSCCRTHLLCAVISLQLMHSRPHKFQIAFQSTQ